MSQAGIANLGVIPPPPGSVTDLQGQDGITVPPNGAGIIFVVGAVAAAGTTPFTTTGNAGTSTETWTIQRTQAAAVSAANIVGLAAFNSAEFTVDANGFVSLAGGGLAVDSFAMQTGTSPVVPTAAGLVTFNGAVVAAGTNPVRTDGTGANTMALEVQISQAIAASNATNIGLAAFNSANFTVDANGFVTLVNGGDLHITPFIVSAAGITNGANFTTIQSALDAANAAGGGVVYVQPGTYTENLTLYDNVDIYATPAVSQNQGATVSIIGQHIPPASGHAGFNSVYFQNTSHIFNSAVAGTAHLVFVNCESAVQSGYFLNLPNWTGTLELFDNNPNAAGAPFVVNDSGINNTGGAVIVAFSAGIGSGGSSTMNISNFIIAEQVEFGAPINFQGSSSLDIKWCNFGNAITISNSVSGSIQYSTITGGASAAVTMSSSAAVSLLHCTIDSSNNPAIAGAGAGTLTYSDLVFLSNSAFAGTLTLATVSWRPYSVALAATDGTRVGTCNFNSAHFTVDANGFVSATGAGFTWNDVSGAFSPLTQNGYFITGTATGTLPASPVQGDTIKFFVDHASQVLTIDAPGTQIIRLGSLVSSAGGTMTSTQQGDSVELVYRAADTCWCAIAGFSGTWIAA